MVLTGAILFSAEAVKCYKSPFFRAKLLLLLVAGLNALVFHKTVFRSVTAWGIRTAPRLGAPSWRVAARWRCGLALSPWDGRSPMLSDSFRPYFEWCGNTWLGATVRDTVWAFPLIETLHLLALAVLLGTVLIVNLRVFGLGQRYVSAAQIARQLEPWMLASLGVLIASGIPMAFSEPIKCFESYSFPIKMSLIVIGIASQLTIQRRWVLSGDASARKAKLAAALSIAIWTAVGAAGKGIPYV